MERPPNVMKGTTFGASGNSFFPWIEKNFVFKGISVNFLVFTSRRICGAKRDPTRPQKAQVPTPTVLMTVGKTSEE